MLIAGPRATDPPALALLLPLCSHAGTGWFQGWPEGEARQAPLCCHQGWRRVLSPPPFAITLISPTELITKFSGSSPNLPHSPSVHWQQLRRLDWPAEFAASEPVEAEVWPVALSGTASHASNPGREGSWAQPPIPPAISPALLLEQANPRVKGTMASGRTLPRSSWDLASWFPLPQFLGSSFQINQP